MIRSESGVRGFCVRWFAQWPLHLVPLFLLRPMVPQTTTGRQGKFSQKCRTQVKPLGYSLSPHRFAVGSPALPSPLLDHGVGVMIVDRLVVFRFDPIPSDPGIGIGFDGDIAH
jgi:hypothetical protein